MRYWNDAALYVLYAVASVVGLLLLKTWLKPMQLGFQITSLPVKPILYVCAGAMLYIFSFLAWLVILTRQELSVAYPIAIGLTLTFSTIGAVVYLGEPVSFVRTAGIVFIFSGILLIARS
jgi:drug/metabolite transporter (DMT)-like permease